MTLQNKTKVCSGSLKLEEHAFYYVFSAPGVISPSAIQREDASREVDICSTVCFALP